MTDRWRERLGTGNSIKQRIGGKMSGVFKRVNIYNTKGKQICSGVGAFPEEDREATEEDDLVSSVAAE